MTGNRLCFLIATVLFAVAALLGLAGEGIDFPWILTGLAFFAAGHLV